MDALATAELCLEAFKRDHNTEHLVDAANYLMFRYMYPMPGESFRATDSSGSVGTLPGTPDLLCGLDQFPAFLCQLAQELFHTQLVAGLCQFPGVFSNINQHFIASFLHIDGCPDGTTQVSLDDALVKLIEECADVLLCIDALTLEGVVDPVGVQFVGRYKNDRWYRRVVKGEDVK